MPTVIIIGASSGLGREIALTYINRGYRVGVAARRLECLTDMIAMAPDRVKACRIDVNDINAAKILENFISEFDSPVDLFVNCAGIGFANPQLEPQRDIDTVATNCLGFTRIIDCMFNYYAANSLKGQIASISSIAGTRGIGIAASYSASKRFQSEYFTALTQLARQHKLPITLTDIKPGFIDTPLLDSGTKYPMIMTPQRATKAIVKAIDRSRNRVVINRRWAIVVGLWKCIPGGIWRRMRLGLSSKKQIN